MTIRGPFGPNPNHSRFDNQNRVSKKEPDGKADISGSQKDTNLADTPPADGAIGGGGLNGLEQVARLNQANLIPPKVSPIETCGIVAVALAAFGVDLNTTQGTGAIANAVATLLDAGYSLNDLTKIASDASEYYARIERAMA